MVTELSKQAISVLQNCKVENFVVRLPEGQLDRKLYEEVKKKLERIGGKWKGGKIAGFAFETDPTELLEKIAGGQHVHLKKDFQFFATPADLANKLVELAKIEDGDLVLEPSAGQGAIIEAIYRAFPRCMNGPNDRPCVTVDYFELMEVNRQILSRRLDANKNWLSRTSCMGDDFLSIDLLSQYKRIIANPPFSKNQDIEHISTMYTVLSPGGRMVTLASPHWQISGNKKETQFTEWLENVGAEIVPVPAGCFKESGTTIASCIIIIDKE